MAERATPPTLPLPPTLRLSGAASHRHNQKPLSTRRDRCPGWYSTAHAHQALENGLNREQAREGQCCHSDSTVRPRRKLYVPCARPKQGQPWGQPTAYEQTLVSTKPGQMRPRYQSYHRRIFSTQGPKCQTEKQQ